MKIGKRTALTKELTRKEVNRRNNIKRLIISVATGLIIFIALLIIQSSILNQEKKIQVYQVNSDIISGTKITEANIDQYLKLTDVQESLVPAGYITDKNDIIEKFVNRDYKAKDVITSDGITDTEKIYRDNIENPVEVSFSSDSISAAVSGIIREGDYINIYGFRVNKDEDSDFIAKDPMHTFMHVYVTKVFNGDGTRIYSADIKPEAEDRTTLFNVILAEADATQFLETIPNCQIKLAVLLYDTTQDYQDFIIRANENTGLQHTEEISNTEDNEFKQNDVIENGNSSPVVTEEENVEEEGKAKDDGVFNNAEDTEDVKDDGGDLPENNATNENTTEEINKAFNAAWDQFNNQ